MAISNKALATMALLSWAMSGQGEALVSTTEARAENAKDIQAGREFSVKACSPCHLVTAQSLAGRDMRSEGPSFEEIAQGPKAAPEALRAFLRSTQSSVGHPGAMPNPELTEDQIQLISAYLASLRRPK